MRTSHSPTEGPIVAMPTALHRRRIVDRVPAPATANVAAESVGGDEALRWTLRQVRGHVQLLQRLPDMLAGDGAALDQAVLEAQAAIVQGLAALADGRPCSHCERAARVGVVEGSA